VSVVGYNDMPFSDHFNPPMTTVRIPHYEIGAAGAELLLGLLSDSGDGRTQMVLQPSLVVRGSTVALDKQSPH
jgi:LacI family transcriptional regulator